MTATRRRSDARADPSADARPRRPARPNAASRDRRDGVRIAYEVYGAGEPTIVLLPSTPIVHSRQWKGQIPYLSRHAPGRRLRRPRQRPVGPADRSRRVPRATDRRRHRGRHGRHRHRRAPSSSGCAATASGGRSSSPATQPERVPGIVAFAAGVPLLVAAASVAGRRTRSTTSCRPTRAGRSSTATTGGATTPGFVALLLRGDHVRAALDEGDRGRRRVGARRLGRRDDRRHATSTFTLDRRVGRGDLSRRPCPMLLVHGTEDLPAARARRSAWPS